MRRLLLPASLALLLWAACGKDPEPAPRAPDQPAAVADPFALADNPNPASARWAQAKELSADLEAPRHASDGGGEGVLLDEAGAPLEVGRAVARRPGSWHVRYTAGELGIAVGGALYFLPEPFWGWSAPQVRSPGRLGYTKVSTSAEGVELEVSDLGPMLRIGIAGRALASGETLDLVYGAEGSLALADTQAERGAHLWLAVDGDGDGVRKVLADSPTIDVAPGPPAMLELLVRGAARVGDEAELVATLLDAYGNPCPQVKASLRLSQRPEGWELPDSLPIEQGRASLRFACPDPGILRLKGRVELDGLLLEDEANPLWIGPDTPRVLWADLHGHSNLSDGTGTPEDWFRYARDVALLDVAALTDHDHFGVLFLDQHPDMWKGIQEVVEQFHEPGRFVAVLGYEWTSWIHGHRHVLYFTDRAPLLSSLDPKHTTPRQLWDALRGQPALTFAHHTAGDPVATNWSFAPDPELEPLVEVLSVHGSSEARDAPRTVRGARDGYFVRDQLVRGSRLGFIGSGDSHDGHPGLAHRSPMYGAREARGGQERQLGTGGLAAILCESRTREAVLESLRAKRTYATSGPRALIQARIGEHQPGGEVDPATSALILEVEAVADGAFERLDLITSWDGVRSMDLAGQRRFQGSFDLYGYRPGAWCYLRFLQTDGGQIVTSPFYFVDVD